MDTSESMVKELVALLEKHTPAEGLNETGIPDLATFRQSELQERHTTVYQPFMAILGQGKKLCYVNGDPFDYSAGRYLSVFLPIPLEVEVVEASVDKPLLMAGIKIDINRIANILLKMERGGKMPAKPTHPNPSSIISEPVNNNLLDPIIRLLRTLDNPTEQAVLGDLILEEIYFRIICNDASGSLQYLLQHRGQVQQISKVVDHIHQNLDEVVSVDQLAEMVNMSASGFRKTFRAVMHMPPLQYAKSIKLDRAQLLIREGKNAGEAGYLVGYNSPAQFSREYKRHFGISPSETRTVFL